MWSGTNITKVDVAATVPPDSTRFSGAVTMMLKIQRREWRHEFLYIGADEDEAISASTATQQTDKRDHCEAKSDFG